MSAETDTELAAALFSLLGEPVPHDPKLEAKAENLRRQLPDTKQALLKVAELCGEPKTAQQFYICTKVYSWLGRQYDSKTIEYANQYLSTSGWDALPSGAKIENGINMNLSNMVRAGILADLGSACAGSGDFQKACSAYLKAYELEPYRVNYAIEISNALIRLGRLNEAKTFLLLQKKNPFYKPVRYRDELGTVNYNYFFRETLDQQIENVDRRIKKLGLD